MSTMKPLQQPTLPSRSTSRARMRGLSIIELLVGLTIGLIILTAIGAIYVNVTNLLRQREDQSQLNDPARVVTQILRQDLMQAGYVDIFDLESTGGTTQAALLFMPDEKLQNLFLRRNPPAPETLSTPLGQIYPGLTPVFGCDGAMQSDPYTIASASTPLVPACGAAHATRHSIRIAYQALPRTAGNALSSLTAADPDFGIGLDCLQQGSGATPTNFDFITINQYFIRDEEGSRRLSCRGSRAAQVQDLAVGVEEFVLRYQVSAPGAAAAAAPPVAAGASQAQYVSAATVADATANPQGWAGVTAVEICLVSATDDTRPAAQGTTALQPTRPTCARTNSGQFANNVAREAGDRRLWKRFTTVVSLRNAIYATPN